MANPQRLASAVTEQQNRERRLVIERWMETIITDGGIDRFDDLHIDSIDKTWDEQNLWCGGYQ